MRGSAPRPFGANQNVYRSRLVNHFWQAMRIFTDLLLVTFLSSTVLGDNINIPRQQYNERSEIDTDLPADWIRPEKMHRFNPRSADENKIKLHPQYSYQIQINIPLANQYLIMPFSAIGLHAHPKYMAPVLIAIPRKNVDYFEYMYFLNNGEPVDQIVKDSRGFILKCADNFVPQLLQLWYTNNNRSDYVAYRMDICTKHGGLASPPSLVDSDTDFRLFAYFFNGCTIPVYPIKDSVLLMDTRAIFQFMMGTKAKRRN
jgi:hypothetical protein